MSADETRYFAFLLYPRGIPKDWETKLELMDIPMTISPSHDKGRSNVEGQEYKKAHYHVIYAAASPVTTHSVRRRIQRALRNKSIAKVWVIKQGMENMYLYLTYENKSVIAESRYGYAKKDIELLSNFDTDRYVVLDIEDKEEASSSVCDIINDHGLANIRELRRFVKEHGSNYNLPSIRTINSVLRSHTGLIRLYFDAMYQERKYGQGYVDAHTGETKKWFWIFRCIRFCTRKWL